jgi:hypothetical protein
MTFAGGGRMGRFLGATESAACVTEPKLELHSGSVAGAAGKGRYVGVPTQPYKTRLNYSFNLNFPDTYWIFKKNYNVLVCPRMKYLSVYLKMSLDHILGRLPW